MSPIPGIAATVDRDTGLASHPAVLAYPSLASEKDILYDFVGVNTGNPLVPGRLELIDVPEYGVKGVRIWASYVGNPGRTTPNEKLVAWWLTLEPKLKGPRSRPYQRNYGEGYTHLFVRYLLRIGEDFLTGAGVLGGKLPGMTGTYNVQSEGTAPPDPYWSAFASWEARLVQGAPTPQGIPLGVYAYVTRNPSHIGDRSDPPALFGKRVRGLPATPGRYDGSGNPEYWRWMTSGLLQVGRWHCLEQEVKLNTVKNVAFVTPPAIDRQSQLDAEAAALKNANEDGEMRVWLDGKLVGEWLDVAYRGEDRVRIYAAPFVNIYQGGRGTYPKGPEHYDLCALVAASKYIGPPASRSDTHAATPAARQTLGSLAAALEAGTWSELIAEDIDAVIGVEMSVHTGVAIPLANSVPWCPIRKRIVLVGQDRGDDPARHIEYDDATNRYLLIDRGLGSHNYQHVAVDPYSSDIYQRWGEDLYRYTGTTWAQASVIPSNIAQIASVALAWWSGPYPGAGGHGVLTVYNGNEGTISAFDPTTGTWLPNLIDVLPGQKDHYHVVSAYSGRHNCLVYGGGNPVQGESPVDRQIWRLNADLSKTRMPDAPHHVGIFSGMNLVSDSASGNIIAFGFGEGWELNPSGAGTWTQLTGPRAPPQGLLSPNVSPNSVISCDVSTYGVVVYVDALRSRKPKCRMWVYKSQ